MTTVVSIIVLRIVAIVSLLLLWNDYCDGLLQQQTGCSFRVCSSIANEHHHYRRVHGCCRQRADRRILLSSKSNAIMPCFSISMREAILIMQEDDSSFLNDTTKKKKDNNDSWSHWLSSPEKYAHALNMTIQQVQEVKEERKRAVQELQDQLSRIKVRSSSNSDSAAAAAAAAAEQCHFLVCQHRYRYGKHPFVCRTCWSYQPICICAQSSEQPQQEQKINLPLACRDVILWTHHEEWGSPSNTGSVLSIMLDHVQLWMKGYHDVDMHKLLRDDTIIPVLLWPSASLLSPTGNDDDDYNNNNMEAAPSSSSASSPLYPHVLTTKHQLQDLLNSSSSSSSDNKKQIVLIAMEGTWRQARRLVAKFPKDIPRLSFTTAATLPVHGKVNDDDKPKQKQHHSILHPLRRQNRLNDDDPNSDNNMCTAEAVVAALQLLGMSMQESNQVLNAVRLKVDRTRRYQGKPLLSPDNS